MPRVSPTASYRLRHGLGSLSEKVIFCSTEHLPSYSTLGTLLGVRTRIILRVILKSPIMIGVFNTAILSLFLKVGLGPTQHATMVQGLTGCTPEAFRLQ